jgi:hypothetical protein
MGGMGMMGGNPMGMSIGGGMGQMGQFGGGGMMGLGSDNGGQDNSGMMGNPAFSMMGGMGGFGGIGMGTLTPFVSIILLTISVCCRWQRYLPVSTILMFYVIASLISQEVWECLV